MPENHTRLDQGLASRVRWLIAIITLLLLWPTPYFPKLRAPNELVRIYLIRAIVDDHTVQLDAAFKRYGPLTDFARDNGHIYADKAPGLSLLGVPLYAALRVFRSADDISNAELLVWLRYILLIAPTTLWLVCLARWLTSMGASVPIQATTVVAYALGTSAFAYSVRFLGHQSAAVTSILTIYLLTGETNRRRLVGAGMLAALSVAIEYPAIFAALGGLWLLRATPRKVVPFLAGMLVPAVVLGLYHTLAFGAPWRLGYAHVGNPYFAEIHSHGLLGVGWPSFEALVQLTLGWQRGLLLLTPCVVLAIWGWRRPADILAQRDVLWALLLQIVGASFIAISFGFWLGGWSVGPRHVVVALPALAVLMGRALVRLESHRVLRTVALASIVWSVLVACAAALTFPGFPEDIPAPLSQLTWPLVNCLRGPQSIGTSLLGLRSDHALLLSLIGALLTLIWALAGLPTRLRELGPAMRRATPALLLGTLALGVFVWLSPENTPESTSRRLWLANEVFEPKDVGACE